MSGELLTWLPLVPVFLSLPAPQGVEELLAIEGPPEDEDDEERNRRGWTQGPAGEGCGPWRPGKGCAWRSGQGRTESTEHVSVRLWHDVQLRLRNLGH